MFDAARVEPISKLIGISREPSNEEMQAAATVALEMVCSVVNSFATIAEKLDAVVTYRHNEAAVSTRQT